MKSGISNFTVIVATLFVGWISSIGWHLAFLVYLVPLIPLCLMPFLTRKYIDKHKLTTPASAATTSKAADETRPSIKKPDTTGQIAQVVKISARKRIWLLLSVIGLYVALTYGTTVISDYLPFTMKHYSLSSGEVGIATSMFFVGATVSGFTLTHLIHIFKRSTIYVALALCVTGLYVCGFVHSLIAYVLAVFFIGIGYGILQPVIYDKTAHIAPTGKDSTKYFAYTLTGNYIAIAIIPFVVDMFARIFEASTINFPYILNGSLLLAVLCLGFFKSRSFVFSMVGANTKTSAD